VAAGSARLSVVNALAATEGIANARRLFEEYATSLGISLCLQGFDQELATLPGRYAPPQGRLLLAVRADELAGCVALRSLEPGVCEMKRLFVRPAYRGLGVGRLLVDQIMQEAINAGYGRMRLDTLPSMTSALTLYRQLGFREIAPYLDNPLPGALYLELALGRPEEPVS
jgi:putative acetyltransferase